LQGETAESLTSASAVFVLIVSGTDETTGQILMARNEYSCEDIRWNATCRDILEKAPDGTTHVDYGKFHDIVPL
jgi:inward rectifier potassium channel